MVEDLCGIIEDATGRYFNNIVKAHILLWGAFEEAIELIDICLMVFAVVIFKGFFRYIWLQSIFFEW